MLQNKYLECYFGKFALSAKMRKIAKLITGNPALEFLRTGFRLNMDEFKKNCVFEIMEQKNSADMIRFCDLSAIADLVLSMKGRRALEQVYFLARETGSRIGYSIRDENVPALKIFLFFDKGLKNDAQRIRKCLRLFGFEFQSGSLKKDKSILGLEFAKNITALSYYEPFKNLLHIPPEASVKTHRSTESLNICKNAYYYIARKISKCNNIIAKKLYKVYDNEDISLIAKEIKRFLKNELLIRAITEDFRDCKIDAVGLRLDNGSKDVYLTSSP